MERHRRPNPGDAPATLLANLRDSTLAPDEFFPFFANADFGLAALAMERNGLREGSTLKVREMLAAGIPVFSTHSDPSFPQEFDFFRLRDEIRLEDFVEFAGRMKAYSRSDVRLASEMHISKELIMRDFLEKLLNETGKGIR